MEFLRAGSQVAHHEIQGDEQQALLSANIIHALPQFLTELSEGAPGSFPGRFVHVCLPEADRHLKAGGDQKAEGIDGEQGRRAAHAVIDHRRQRAGEFGQVYQQAIDRIPFLEIPLGDEVGIKAVKSHDVGSVDDPREKADRQQSGIAEPPAPQQQEQQEIDPRRQEVQGIDHLFPAHAVQPGPRQNGTDHDGQLKAHLEQHVQKGGACVVQDQQTEGEIGQSVPHQ